MDLIDVEATEMVEQQLDAFIERRAREAADEGRIEELWSESERLERKKRRRENRAAWRSFHCHMQELHASLAEGHRAKAEALLEQPMGEGGLLDRAMHRYEAQRGALYAAVQRAAGPLLGTRSQERREAAQGGFSRR